MKGSLLTFFISSLLCFAAHAQTIPNGSFENWTPYTAGSYNYEVPDGWRTTDSITQVATSGALHSAIKEATEVHTGNFALKLIGWPSIFGNAPGAATNGDIDLSNLSDLKINKGVPDTIRHAKLHGQYRFVPLGGDTCSISVALVKWNSITGRRDTIAHGQFTSNLASGGTGYSPFTIDLAYNSWTEHPDTLVILLLTSPLKLGSGTPGTVLYVDNLSFTGVVSINEVTSIINSVDVFPSPASSKVTIRVDLKKNIPLHFSIHDLSGKHVFSDVLEPHETQVNVSEFPNGNYTLHLHDGRNRIYSSNFLISR